MRRRFFPLALGMVAKVSRRVSRVEPLDGLPAFENKGYYVSVSVAFMRRGVRDSTSF